MANKKSEYEELIEKHDREIKVLQSVCQHKNSTWMEEWWAIGHSTGYTVLVCDNCHKKLEKKKHKEVVENGKR